MAFKFLVEHTQHLPKMVKDTGDVLSLGSILTYMMGVLTPFFEFIVVFATAIWFVLRSVDLAWNLIDRWKGKKKKGES